jgi:hypothetical protein
LKTAENPTQLIIKQIRKVAKDWAFATSDHFLLPAL